MEALRWIASDASVIVDQVDVEELRHPGTRPDAVVDVTTGSTRARFAVEERHRAPYPNEIPSLGVIREALARYGQPLISVPFVPESAGRLLTQAGWSWADDLGNFDLRAPNVLLHQRRAVTPPRPVQRLLPQGTGSLAIIRFLIRLGQNERSEVRTTDLANQVSVSQPRVSQVMNHLYQSQLVERTEGGAWTPIRQALLDRFLVEYSGPSGPERYYYSLDSPSEVAVRAAQNSDSQKLAISADVGPDLITPWRRPTTLIIYTTSELEASNIGAVDAQGLDDANVIVSIPKDQSVFATPPLTAEFAGAKIPLADPSQMVWDLERLGGADRLEAAGHMRQWLVSYH